MKEFIKKMINIFELDINSIHGISHWLSVYRYLNILSKNEDINKNVLFYFAFLHDSHRQNEDIDIDHGYRAAEFIYQNKKLFKKLNNHELHQLYIACKNHNTDKIFNDKTIETCIDADRLDLKRFNYKIDKNKLYTEKAKKLEKI